MIYIVLLFKCVSMTGIAEVCIIHTSDFVHLEIHKHHLKFLLLETCEKGRPVKAGSHHLHN